MKDLPQRSESRGPYRVIVVSFILMLFIFLILFFLVFVQVIRAP